jgi:hypothetical protein
MIIESLRKSQLKKEDIPPTPGRSKKMTDDKSPIGGTATLLDMRHLLNMCGVRSADGSDLGRTIPMAIALEMGDGDTPFSLVRKDFLISSLEVLSRVGKQKSVNVAAPAVTGSESNLVKPSTSRRDSLSKITINTFDLRPAPLIEPLSSPQTLSYTERCRFTLRDSEPANTDSRGSGLG